uniref:Uncharacterized protein n=1 Tax=Caenorhabditis japonica TaxID=281687 RepID=A0A8R1HS18_CAEJA
MQENIGVESNVNSEMSDLVHLAEEWASARTGFNRVPEVSVRELRTHKIGKHIVTRAALRLLEQLGIKSVDDYTKHFGRFENESKEKEEEKERVISPVSPMTVDEFQSILKSGWPIDEPLPSSPFGSRRRTSMLADLIPLSPIASEARDVSPSPPNKFAIPKLAKRKSEPATATATANRKLFATTPRDKETFSFRKSMPDTPNQRKGDIACADADDNDTQKGAANYGPSLTTALLRMRLHTRFGQVDFAE